MTRLFTKSAFKVALSCPWKLYYYRNPDVYSNANQGDEFLESLAEGGFQVGELAKYYCQVDADADLKNQTDYYKSLNKTAELMKRENVTIAEAAFRYGDLFVRVDILKKTGNQIELIEVKAKSWDPQTDSFLGTRPKGCVKSDIREYVYDVAFQKYVVANALGEAYSIKAFLMMADKSKETDVDGLNTLFKIKKNDCGHAEVICVNGYKEVLDASKVDVLTAFDVDDICNGVIAGETAEQKSPDWMQGLTFTGFVQKAAASYVSNVRYDGNPTLCGTCFKCEFRKASASDPKKDGKAECWKDVAGYGDKPLVESLNGSSLGKKRGDWVKDGTYFLDELTKAEVKLSSEKAHDGLDDYERKWLQIALETQNENLKKTFAGKLKGNTYLDVEGLRKEMDTWKFPLHMIDFETTAVALPYYAGMRPYEQVAFQFSHHVIYEDGTVEHKGQYLNEDVSKFPNFVFVRNLKEQLEKDGGTVFRYAAHENTILREIARQLKDSCEPDKDSLIKFIRSITHNDKADKGEIYKGDRDMVDLLEIIKKYFYNLDEMHGSNSIKQVLPAVLNCSQVLKDKYSKPIYGKEIKSCNFTEKNPKAWITTDSEGHVESPYHLLESVGKLINLSEEEMKKSEEMASQNGMDFEVTNGGAALTAYNKLMFCEDTVMSNALRSALLRYCELDTMSMVFIWEYFQHEVYGNILMINL